jgi:hypothetical protein
MESDIHQMESDNRAMVSDIFEEKQDGHLSAVRPDTCQPDASTDGCPIS